MGWFDKLLGRAPAPAPAPVAMPKRTTAVAPAAAPAGFGVRRPLVASSGEVAGFEFCLAASVEERLKRRADPVAQAAHALALLSSMRATLEAGRMALASLSASVLARPNVEQQLPAGAHLCVDTDIAVDDTPGDSSPDGAPDLPSVLRSARARGLRIGVRGLNALPGLQPDFRLLVEGTGGLERLLTEVRQAHAADPQTTLIVSGLGSVDAIEAVLAAGAALACGSFGSSPLQPASKPLQGDVQRIIQLLNSVRDEQQPLSVLTQDLRADVALSYRLLRHVNSPAVGLSRAVESIDQAVLMLGRAELHRWLSVLLLSSVHGRKASRALQEVSLARAKLLETLAREQPGQAPDALFTVGLLSLLDVMLKTPLAQALGPLRLSEPARLALIERTGPWARWLQLAESLERHDLATAGEIAQDFGGLEHVTERSDDAWRWASSVQRELQTA